jgi:dipeptidyl aminopeptidase/acylaminoacyl peptidase
MNHPRAGSTGVALLLCLLTALVWGKESAAAATLPRTTQNVPDIPPELNLGLERYQNTRGARLGGWLADGSLLILTRFGDTEQVHRVASPLGMREQLTFSAEPVSTLITSPHHNRFVYLQDQRGDEFWQIQLRDLVTGDSTQITAGGRTRNQEPVMSPSGRLLAFGSTERNGTDTDIWIADLETRERHIVTREAGTWYPLGFSPDDRSLLVMQYVSITDTRPARIELATGALERLPVDGDGEGSVNGNRAAITHMSWDPSGNGIWFVSDESSEFRTLRFHHLKSQRIEQVSAHIPWDVEWLDIAPDGTHLAFVTNEGGISQLHVIGLPEKTRIDLPSLPVGVIEGIAFDRDGQKLAINLNAATSPRDVYVADLPTKTLTRWTRSETGGIDSAGFVSPRLFHFPTFDDANGARRRIPAFWYQPKGKGPFPVVIRIHGGPEGQELPVFNPLIQYLVREEKIAVLMPNVRGSAGYGKTWLSLDNGRKRKDAVRDIGALLDWIEQEPTLDANRIGVTGGSYGGYMVLATMIDYPERIRAGIDLFGISDFRTFLANTESYRRDLRRAEYGDERIPEVAAFFASIAPLHHATRIAAPLLVAQGAADPRVPQSESEQIVRAIQRAGQAVWYILFDNEGHGFTKKTNVDFNNAANVLFWRHHLLPIQTDPTDKGDPQ